MALCHIIDHQGRVFTFHSRVGADRWVEEDLQRQRKANPLGYHTRLRVHPGRPAVPVGDDHQAPPTPWHDLEDVRTWAVLEDGAFIWVADETLVRAGIVTVAELDVWWGK